jgi:hypothetical protein
MPNVVVTADDKAQTAQVFGESGIPGKIFAHAMAKLDNRAGLHVLRAKDIVGHMRDAVGAGEYILRALDIHKYQS